MKHLFLQTAFLGDLLLSVPTLQRIREWDPEADITLICRYGYGRLLTKLGYVDHALEVDKSDKDSWKELQDDLTDMEFDYFFSPHMSIRSNFLSRKIKAKTKVGYRRNWNAPLYNVRVERPMHLPEAMRQLALMMPFDEDLREKMSPYIRKEKDVNQVEEWASMTTLPFPKELDAEERPYICMAPGSVWPTKRWTPEGFIGLGKKFIDEGYDVVLIGARDERNLCHEIHTKIPGSKSVAGSLRLEESLQNLAKASLLVSNDSGAMHLASLVGTPTVAVFGPTIPDFGYIPWQNHAKIVDTPLKCRPCGKHGHVKCPIGTHECMTAVHWEMVHGEATKLLEASKGSEL